MKTPRLGTQSNRYPQPRALLAHILDRVTVQHNGCWTWDRNVDHRGGYALLQWKGKTRRVHIAMWHLTHDHPLQPGQEIGHASKCPHRHCVNPRHLKAMSHADNMKMSRGHGHNVTKQRVYLTEQHVRDIRELAANNRLNVRRFAASVNIDPAAVRLARDGKTHKGVAL